jgi:hypothetical protein
MYLVLMRHGFRPGLRVVPLLISLVLCHSAAAVSASSGAGESAARDNPNGGSSAKTTPAPKKKKPARVPLPPPDRVEISIPYPNAGMYLYRGIYASFAGGRSYQADTASAKGWQDPLFQWQGEVGYFYREWFSGGAGFGINAGAPSDSQQTVQNRYYLITRFHHAFPRAAGYVGLRLGMDDVNFALQSSDTADLGEPLRETNAAVGLEAGGGWKFSRYGGLTLGQRMDVSLVRQSAKSPNRAVTFMTQPGLAIDMVRVHPLLGTNVKAFYLLTELQFAQSLSESGEWTQQFAWITGLSLAF